MMSLWPVADHEIGGSLRGAQVLQRGPKHGVRDPRGAGDDHTETEAGA
jgi:hypothetical protein